MRVYPAGLITQIQMKVITSGIFAFGSWSEDKEKGSFCTRTQTHSQCQPSRHGAHTIEEATKRAHHVCKYTVWGDNVSVSMPQQPHTNSVRPTPAVPLGVWIRQLSLWSEQSSHCSEKDVLSTLFRGLSLSVSLSGVLSGRLDKGRWKHSTHSKMNLLRVSLQRWANGNRRPWDRGELT